MAHEMIAGFTRVKRITGQSAYARFLAETTDFGHVARVPEIPSPYAYSPEWMVYDWAGRRVIVRETLHRRFDVFEVPATVAIRPLPAKAIP